MEQRFGSTGIRFLISSLFWSPVLSLLTLNMHRTRLYLKKMEEWEKHYFSSLCVGIRFISIFGEKSWLSLSPGQDQDWTFITFDTRGLFCVGCLKRERERNVYFIHCPFFSCHTCRTRSLVETFDEKALKLQSSVIEDWAEVKARESYFWFSDNIHFLDITFSLSRSFNKKGTWIEKYNSPVSPSLLNRFVSCPRINFLPHELQYFLWNLNRGERETIKGLIQ